MKYLPLLLFLFMPSGNKLVHKKKVTSGLFYMKFGGVICGEHYIDVCGVHLVKCNDEVEYHCIHDVSMRLDEKYE